MSRLAGQTYPEPSPLPVDSRPVALTKVQNLREKAQRLLGGAFGGFCRSVRARAPAPTAAILGGGGGVCGPDTFEPVYKFLCQARRSQMSDAAVQKALAKLVPNAVDCFIVDQLVYEEMFAP